MARKRAKNGKGTVYQRKTEHGEQIVSYLMNTVIRKENPSMAKQKMKQGQKWKRQ